MWKLFRDVGKVCSVIFLCVFIAGCADFLGVEPSYAHTCVVYAGAIPDSVIASVDSLGNYVQTCQL